MSDFENRMRAMARHGSYEAFLRLDDGQRRSFIESLTTPAEPGLLRAAAAVGQYPWGMHLAGTPNEAEAIDLIERLRAALRAAPEPPRAWNTNEHADFGATWPNNVSVQRGWCDEHERYDSRGAATGGGSVVTGLPGAAPEPPLAYTTVPFADRMVCGAVTSDGRFSCARRRGHEGPHTDADNLDDEEWRTFAAAPEPPREAGLDVERLARALAAAEVGCWANPAVHPAADDDFHHLLDAKAVAVEYDRLSESGKGETE